MVRSRGRDKPKYAPGSCVSLPKTFACRLLLSLFGAFFFGMCVCGVLIGPQMRPGSAVIHCDPDYYKDFNLHTLNYALFSEHCHYASSYPGPCTERPHLSWLAAVQFRCVMLHCPVSCVVDLIPEECNLPPVCMTLMRVWFVGARVRNASQPRRQVLKNAPDGHQQFVNHGLCPNCKPYGSTCVYLYLCVLRYTHVIYLYAYM